jgi:signal transduction histidine kinase
MAKPERRWWWSNPPMVARYGVAVVSVTVALIGSRLLDVYLVTAPVSLFLCAVMFSAWYGGFRPGLLATVLSVLAFKYYFTATVYSLTVDIKELPRLLFFALSALFVGLLSAAQRRAQEMQAAFAREREKFALQRAAELGKANEALRGSLDALASVQELDDFLGQVIAIMTRQLGAISSTLRVRNFEENTLPLELVFQDGRIMTPDEAKYPERWQSVPLESFDPEFLCHSDCTRTKDQDRAPAFFNPPAAIIRVLDPQSPMPEDQRSYLRGLGVKTVLIIPLTSRGQANGRVTFRFLEERDFHPEELEIARALGTQASLAIHLTRLAKSARQAAVLEERNHLAGEIHDSLAQFFTGISMQLGVAKEVINAEEDEALTCVDRAAELAQYGLAEARRSAFSLGSTVTEESGLIEALQKLVERSNIPGSLHCKFRSDGVPKERLPPAAHQGLLRITQEAISNALRHAKPTVISVDVRWEERQLVLEVTDNGSGIANPQLAIRGGFGLSSMRARAEKLGAQLDIRTEVSRGTSIVVVLPIE